MPDALAKSTSMLVCICRCGLEIEPRDEEELQMTGLTVNTPFYRAGDWHIVSGITGRVGEVLVSGGFEAEFAHILHRFGKMLDDAKLGRSSVAKVNIYLLDMTNRTRMNEMYLEFFGGHLPARTVVGVNEISRGGQVELEGWVHQPRV
jgi:2-iminobutanoate/2-iminopropanoate deaminase